MDIKLEKLELTNEGIKKLKGLADIYQKNLVVTLRDIEDKMKKTIASFAPKADVELEYLALPGTTANIFKDGFLSLREAIEGEDIAMVIEGDIIRAYYGDPQKINPLIGFTWWKTKDGNPIKRSTADGEAGEAWGTLLERWEFGGQPFTVVGRDGEMLTIAYVDKGVVKQASVTKQIPPATIEPYGMYSKGGKKMTGDLLMKFESTLKKSVRETGFKSSNIKII